MIPRRFLAGYDSLRCLVLLAYAVLATSAQSTSQLDVDANESTSSLLSSVISVSVSASLESVRSAATVAIPTPSDYTAPFPEFESILQTWPPKPTAATLHDDQYQAIIDQISANVTASDDIPTNVTRRAGAMKWMIVGDSMTQGGEGDWTWRYRFWQWTKANNLNVDFVGPYAGTQTGLTPATGPSPPPTLQNAPPSQGGGSLNVNGKYAADVDPAFDSDHFAIWGRPVALDMTLIQGFVKQYQPDFLLVMLGFNDLGWFYSDENGLIANMQTFIDEARKGNPNVKFAIANVPQRLWLGRQDLVDKTNRYNAQLPSLLTKWSTANSPCAHVELRQVYSCGPSSCPAGYDGLHPDSLGDYQIASAFSTTMYNFYKFGSGPLQVPANPAQRPVPTPPNFKVFSSIQGVTATWDPVFGAMAYDVQVSINGGAWQDSGSRSNRFDTVWPFDGATYAVRVRTNCGMFDYLKSPWTTSGSATATPKLAPPPANVKSYATADGWTVTFDPPTGPNTDSIVEYNIIWWDMDAECAFIGGAAYKNSPATLTGLTSGHRILLAPTTWNAAGMSFPVGAPYVRVGNTNNPARISGLKTLVSDPNNIMLTWSAAGDAAGYNIWTRNTLNSTDYLKIAATADGKCWNSFIFYPADYYFEYCVTGYNGIKDSGYSSTQCTIPSAPSSSTSPAPTCAPPAPWCPQFFNPSSAPEGAGDAPAYTQTLTYTSTATAQTTPTTSPGSFTGNESASSIDTSFMIGFYGCDPDTQVPVIKRAYQDAIADFSGSITSGTYPDLDFNNDKDITDWFGTRDNGRDKQEYYIRENFYALINPKAWNPGKYLFIHCDDPGDKIGGNCKMKNYQPRKSLVAAYTVNTVAASHPEPEPPIINFCPPFWNLPTHAARIANVLSEKRLGKEGATFPMDDVRTFRNVQSQIILHELVHLVDWTNINVDISRFAWGLTYPHIEDRVVNDRPGAAYGPERAKYLAQVDRYGPAFAYRNVDNYVYFLVSKFMTSRFGGLRGKPGFSATLPPRSWPTTTGTDPNQPLTFFLETGPTSENPPEALPDNPSGSPPVQAASPTCYGYNGGPSADQNYALDRINQYCNTLSNASTLFSCQAPYVPRAYQTRQSDTQNSLWLSMQWDEANCAGLGPEFDINDCKQYLARTLSNCDTTSTTSKYGGTFQVGCLIYDLQVKAGTSNTPPQGFNAVSTNCRYPIK